MAGRAIDFLVMMDKQSVVKDGDTRRLFQVAGLENRSEEDNIERLPLAGLSAGINQRRRLAVYRSGLAIRINLLGV